MANTYSLDLEASSSQYAYIADNTSLSITGDLTIEAWVKFESHNFFGIVSKYISAGNQRSYALEVWKIGATIDTLNFVVSSDGITPTEENVSWTPALGVWYHVAAVYDASAGSVDFYVNGVQQGTTQTGLATSIFNNAENFNIGAHNGSAYFDGLIDDVRVWNDVRTSGEIAANYDIELAGSEANLVGYWKLNRNLLDSTSSNNLTFSNGNISATYTTKADDEAFGYDVTNKEKAGQPFLVTSNGTVSVVDVYYLCKEGSPTGDISAAIYSDSGGSPGTLLETASNTIDASTLPARGSAGPQSFTFSGTLNLSTSTTYWLVLSKSSLNTTNYCWWGVGSSGRPWSDYKVYSNSSWVAGSASYNCTLVLKSVSFSTDTPLDLTYNLVSYWKLDANSNDSVASNNGTDTNISYDTTTKVIIGSLDTRSTSTSRVVIADSASWDTGTGNFSISGWAYQTTGTAASGLILGSSAWTDAPPMKRYHLDFSGTGNSTMSFGFYDGTNQAVAGYAPGASLRDGWHHIVGTRTAGVATIYVDGVSRATASNTLGTSANCNLTGIIGIALGIGDYSAGNWERFQGYIDEVGFWNRALNADEVTLLYNGGAGFTYPFTVASATSNFFNLF